MPTSTTLAYKLVKENADTLTPIGIFSNLNGQKKFLLESSYLHEKKGKFSFIGADPYQEITGTETETKIKNYEEDSEELRKRPALSILQDYLPKQEVNLPFPFIGGGIGYIGYDGIRAYEEIGDELPDDLGMPDVHLMFYKNIIIFDHSNESVYVLAMNPNQEPEHILDERLENLKIALKPAQRMETAEEADMYFAPDMAKQQFINNVNKAKSYIDKGEVLQVVLSQRMQAKIVGDPFTFYRKLRRANPSPYMFYIDFEDYLVLGASPESLLQTDGDTVITNPIAGTRPRGKSVQEDNLHIRDLLSDEKEVSEHDMLVNLSKDDLAHVCEPDSISAPVYMEIEKYQHVMHMVSEVRGTLKAHLKSIDALIACLPAGTVSGAPKRRAMQIINDLEEKKRGVYGGGIGYIGFDHDLNMALAIRSLVIKEGTAYLQSGAGIVADSVPEKEFEETLNKARSLIEANEYV